MTENSKSIRNTLSFAAVLAATLAATGNAAHSVSRIETTRTDCSDIRATLVREGAAILRYTSRKGLPIYDRYVSSSLMCESPAVGVWASVPARDTDSCRVIRCDPNAADDDGILFNFRPLLRITAP